MKEYARDTSEDYDDLVGFVAEDNLPVDLGEFIDDTSEYKPKVQPKKVNPEFPEEWQSVYVNFHSFEQYADFMEKIGHVPLPKLKEMVFTTEEKTGLDMFFGD